MKINSISLKVTVTLIVSIFSVMIIFGYFYFLYEEEMMLKQLNVSSQESTRRLSTVLSTPVYHNDENEIYRILSIEMLIGESIMSTTVFDNDGKLIYRLERDSDWGLKRAKKEPYFTYDANIFNILKSDIEHEGEKIGFIEMILTDRFATQRITKNLIKILFMFLTFSVVFILVIFIVLKIVIINPILTLTTFVKEYDLCETETANLLYPPDHADEIGELVKEFNDLILRLNQTIHQKTSLLKQLENNNISLEREIKDRIYAEENLRASQKYTDTIFDAIPILFLVVDQELLVSGVNAQVRRFLQKEGTELINQPLSKVLPFTERFAEDIYRLIESNKPDSFRYIKVAKSETDIRYYHLYLKPFSYNKENRGIIQIDDVTESVVREERLFHTLKLETIDELAKGISHDFNNIFGGILGSVFLAKMEIDEEDEKNRELMECLSNIESSSKKAGDLIRKLLSVSAKYPMTSGPVDLQDVIENVLQVCLTTFDKSVTVEYRNEIPEETSLVNGDAVQLEQVLLNLAVNGCHSMTIMRQDHNGWGGKLWIVLDKVFLSEEDKNSFVSKEYLGKEYYVVRVKDQGIGISKENISKVFDPFYTTKSENKGTGLGLSISYSVVKQYNGFITVDSKEEEETLFQVYLPVYQEKLKEIPEEKGEQIRKGSGTVLVIDDNEMMLKVLKSMLNKCGYDVLLAKNGMEGVDLFEESTKQIDLVLLDLVLPRTSGKETYLILKKLNPNLKVILMSGSPEEEGIEGVLALGADDYILKPYSIAKLSDKIYKVLHGSAEELSVSS